MDWYGWTFLPVSGFDTVSSTIFANLFSQTILWPTVHAPFPSGPGVARSVAYIEFRPAIPYGNAYTLFFTRLVEAAPSRTPRSILDLLTFTFLLATRVVYLPAID